MTDSVGMTEYRNPAVIHDILDKLPASAWNNQVNQTVLLQHESNIFPGFKQLSGIGGKTGFYKRVPNTFAKYLICPDRLTSAFQQNCVSAFDTQGCNLDQCIRTAFKNDADHTDRTDHAVKGQSFRQLHRIGCAAKRIRKRCKSFQTVCSLGQFCLTEDEPVKKRRRQLLFRSNPVVFAVRFTNPVKTLFQKIRKIKDCLVSLLHS